MKRLNEQLSYYLDKTRSLARRHPAACISFHHNANL